MKRAIILASISVLCLLQFGWGQIPRTMSYQGVLTDKQTGEPVEGTVDIIFKLFPASDSPQIDVLWSETHSGVQLNNGIFQVNLGSITPLDLDFDSQYWLEIVPEDDPLSPRTQLTASPYSFRAIVADSSWSLTGNSSTTAGRSRLPSPRQE